MVEGGRGVESVWWRDWGLRQCVLKLMFSGELLLHLKPIIYKKYFINIRGDGCNYPREGVPRINSQG